MTLSAVPLSQIAETKAQQRHLRKLVNDGKKMVAHVSLRAKQRALKIKQEVKAEKVMLNATLGIIDAKLEVSNAWSVYQVIALLVFFLRKCLLP